MRFILSLCVIVAALQTQSQVAAASVEIGSVNWMELQDAPSDLRKRLLQSTIDVLADIEQSKASIPSLFSSPKNPKQICALAGNTLVKPAGAACSFPTRSTCDREHVACAPWIAAQTCVPRSDKSTLACAAAAAPEFAITAFRHWSTLMDWEFTWSAVKKRCQQKSVSGCQGLQASAKELDSLRKRLGFDVPYARKSAWQENRTRHSLFSMMPSVLLPCWLPKTASADADSPCSYDPKSGILHRQQGEADLHLAFVPMPNLVKVQSLIRALQAQPVPPEKSVLDFIQSQPALLSSQRDVLGTLDELSSRASKAPLQWVGIAASSEEIPPDQIYFRRGQARALRDGLNADRIGDGGQTADPALLAQTQNPVTDTMLLIFGATLYQQLREPVPLSIKNLPELIGIEDKRKRLEYLQAYGAQLEMLNRLSSFSLDPSKSKAFRDLSLLHRRFYNEGVAPTEDEKKAALALVEAEKEYGPTGLTYAKSLLASIDQTATKLLPRMNQEAAGNILDHEEPGMVVMETTREKGMVEELLKQCSAPRESGASHPASAAPVAPKPVKQ